MAKTIKIRPSPQEFFYAHAGYSYGNGETAAQGRARCAAKLAQAERRASDAGCSFEWSVDPYTTSDDWRTDGTPTYAQWQCLARDADGEVFASLHGIDFGPDKEPWDDPYRRVVEAELACELPEN